MTPGMMTAIMGGALLAALSPLALALYIAAGTM